MTLTAQRSEPRYDLTQFNIPGQIRLDQNHDNLPVVFNDISASGATLTITKEISMELKEELVAFVAASKKGITLPIQLIVNNVRVPITLLNLSHANKFGLCVCKHEKFAALAEKGIAVFKTLVDLAQSKGAQEAAFVDHIFLTRDFLPPEVRQFIENPAFLPWAVKAIAIELPDALPILEELKGNVKELAKIAALYEKFMESRKKDLALIIGSEMYFVSKNNKVPAATLLPKAISRLCSEGRLFHEESDRTDFEKILTTRVLRKYPDKFADLQQKHPLVGIINTRFDNFDKSSNFILTLSQHLEEYYYITYLPRDSEIVKYFGDSKQTIKSTVYRWIHNLLIGMVTTSDFDRLQKIYGNFRQTMYEFVQARKASDILGGDIKNILEGKIDDGEMEIRTRFFNFVCGLIEEDVNLKFREYKHDLEAK
jgi:hypothetical protein